jgi:two-component system CheB/CheR fusion protein
MKPTCVQSFLVFGKPPLSEEETSVVTGSTGGRDKMPAPNKKTTPTKKRKTATKKTPVKAKSPSKRTVSQKRPAKTKKEDFYIVGMGASAGGLEAFEKFFANMPSDTNMAFVLVPHLDPTHVSIMPELLQKHTRLQVAQAEDGMVVQPGRVYMIEPNRDLAIFNGTLQLMEPRRMGGLRMPIDYFFRSLAQDQKDRAICVILSGMGTDGTLGLRAIKGELGMAMVQDADSAKYDGMPRSAIATGLADFVSPPEKMPAQLIDYTDRASRRAALEIPPVEEKASDALAKIFILLRDQTGHDFSAYKKTTIFRRIERRLDVHRLDDITRYLKYLQQTPLELNLLFKELLIGVTNFFRDPKAFEALKEKVLPEMLKNQPDGHGLRVWIPGCSSGEEAYSVGMIIRECTKQLNRNLNVQIFATDIDAEAIETARTGIYPGSISTDVSQGRLKQFFTRHDSSYQINKEIRETCIFAVQDVIKDPPFTKLDLLCCRNLLIYMEAELQKKLLPIFHYALKPEGFLFLGTSETVGGFRDLFSTVEKKWKIYRRRESAAAMHRLVELPVRVEREPGLPAPAKALPDLTLAQLAQRTLLDEYAPPSVIIDDNGTMHYIHGRTGKYLEPAPGEVKCNILDMAREGLRVELPAAMRKVMAEKRDITYEGLRVKGNGSVQEINLTVKPLDMSRTTPGLMMVVFEDVPSPPKEEPVKAKRPTTKRKAEQRIEELEKELDITKENLQITIEEMETSNEELKSSNEELQSTNEELQSTNEELETSKEELQSVNEELMTVNSELEGKIAELSEASNDMKNLLESTEVPSVFLDNDLLVKRFTPYATEVINLIASDIGRPIGHIVTNLTYEKLVKDAETVLNTLVFKETEVQAKDGHWYMMRIMPYRTQHNVIDGVAITFLDIDQQKRAADLAEKATARAERALKFAEDIINTVREPLVVLTEDFRVVSANRTFYDTFQESPQKTDGERIYDLGDKQWDIPGLRQLLEEVIPKNSSFRNFEVEHDFPKVGHKKILLNARRIHRSEQGKEVILLAMEEVDSNAPSRKGQSVKKARGEK